MVQIGCNGEAREVVCRQCSMMMDKRFKARQARGGMLSRAWVAAAPVTCRGDTAAPSLSTRPPQQRRHLISMALSCARFFRFLRSIFVPVITITSFCCLLTFFFVLYQPTHGPGDLQRLGWQAWDVVSTASETPMGMGQAEAGTVDNSHSASGGSLPEGVDWWNISRPADDTVDTASFPLDVWSPLLPHDTGCVYLQVSLNTILTNFYSVGNCDLTVCSRHALR